MSLKKEARKMLVRATVDWYNGDISSAELEEAVEEWSELMTGDSEPEGDQDDEPVFIDMDGVADMVADKIDLAIDNTFNFLEKIKTVLATR